LLVLSANPSKTTPLHLKEEADAIREALGSDPADSRYLVVEAEAVETTALTGLLHTNRPRVLHFSGHGNADGGLNLLDAVGLAQPVAPEALARWFAAVPEGDRPDCVVLNACYTNETARALVQVVKCVVGMSRDFDDDAAIAFATGFYRGLATYEDDYRTAFKLGCAEIDLLGRADSDVPVFSTRLTEMIPRVRGGQLEVDLTQLVLRKRGEENASPVPGARIATVWFGTNRKRQSTRRGTPAFGKERDSTLHVGRCEVVIPRAHKYGSIGSGWWTRLWRGDDRLTVETIKELDRTEFDAGISQVLQAAPEDAHAATVFIHGYCTTFEGAAVRAAQIGCDLSVPGIMAFFSWPSQGTFRGYLSDIDANEAAIRYLIEFLRGLAGVPGVEKIHLIAHSMGNRGLLAALRDMVGARPTPAPMFEQVILAAADVDAEVFKQRCDVYGKVARRTTLYASRRDLALLSSGLIRDNHSRAGFTPPVTVADGIDTVEVTGVDLSLLGHGYFADAAPVLNDIHDLIVNDIPPERRARLESVPTPPHWTFVE
jgi:esterase/lipase superfamily enzyme